MTTGRVVPLSLVANVEPLDDAHMVDGVAWLIDVDEVTGIAFTRPCATAYELEAMLARGVVP